VIRFGWLPDLVRPKRKNRFGASLIKTLQFQLKVLNYETHVSSSIIDWLLILVLLFDLELNKNLNDTLRHGNSLPMMARQLPERNIDW